MDGAEHAIRCTREPVQRTGLSGRSRATVGTGATVLITAESAGGGICMKSCANAILKMVSVLLVGAVVTGCTARAATPGEPFAQPEHSADSSPPTSGPTALPTELAAMGTPAASTSASAGCDTREMFDIALPSDPPAATSYGAKTPLDAAAQFIAQDRQPGYGSADTMWTTVSNGPSQVELISETGATLLVVQLPDRSWTVLSGERCSR